jgi:hypothetical protein
MVGFCVLANSDSRRLVNDPLPPSAALPLTEPVQVIVDRW